jgi:hypothetical protein
MIVSFALKGEPPSAADAGLKGPEEVASQAAGAIQSDANYQRFVRLVSAHATADAAANAASVALATARQKRDEALAEGYLPTDEDEVTLGDLAARQEAASKTLGDLERSKENARRAAQAKLDAMLGQLRGDAIRHALEEKERALTSLAERNAELLTRGIAAASLADKLSQGGAIAVNVETLARWGT